MHRNHTLFACLLLASMAAAATSEWVPCVIPTVPNPASAIAFTPAPIPTNAPRPVVAGGHFTVAGQRLRVWGVNTCFGANFPAHADAVTLASRLSAAGINSVRFHHMDTAAYPQGILEPGNPLRLATQAVDRLDFFIAQLAQQGIYANINLHVGRAASKTLGLPAAGPGTRYDKLIDIFTPALIDAQRRYATDLLTHVNPYRGMRLTDDPAVAFIEITNEDSLFMGGAAAELRALPSFYAEILRARYASWLLKQYGDTDALRQAWSKGGEEPLGASILSTGTVQPAGETGTTGWFLEKNPACAAVLTLRTNVTAIAITKADGTGWHLQAKQTPLTIRGAPSTRSLSARAPTPPAPSTMAWARIARRGTTWG